MTLSDLVGLPRPPVPWQEGDNIPWYDPAFSERMLREHLTQKHDAASRRFPTIDAIVGWIHSHLLNGHTTRILDLGCGPGLYTSRLARLGHECVGIDFGPASVEYARAEAEREGLRCRYRLGDMRTTDYGGGYGLVIQVYGEINVFRPDNARIILRKCSESLAEDGTLLLEAHPFKAVESMGRAAPSWYSAGRGLFSDEPHLYLEESFWNEERQARTTRYIVIAADSGEVTVFSDSMQAYTEDGYRALLGDCGFRTVDFLSSFGPDSPENDDFVVIVARR